MTLKLVPTSNLVNRAAALGRVAVVYGGRSAEREVSLASGRRVLEGLRSIGADVIGIDRGDDFLQALIKAKADRVFLILHGRGGEDGQIQGLLESIGIPYTGSGVLGSALAMDKGRAKQIWQSLGLPTPQFELVTGFSALDAAVERLGLPVFIKPVREGSSVGATPVREYNQIADAWKLASTADKEVLIETLIEGTEYTVAILAGRALPVIRLEPTRQFYDYQAKYADDSGTRYHCPCGLEEEEEARIQEISLRAFEALDARGWGRIDLMRDVSGRAWLLELNTAPGMTTHSLVPMAAAGEGISFEELVLQITELTL